MYRKPSFYIYYQYSTYCIYLFYTFLNTSFKYDQGQFNDYVIKLRMEYNEKVGTFKRIIEIHQAELKKSQDFWLNSVKVTTSFFNTT